MNEEVGGFEPGSVHTTDMNKNKWVGLVARITETRDAHNFLIGRLKGRNELGDLNAYRRIQLKLTLKNRL
jgi:hypothetical protein